MTVGRRRRSNKMMGDTNDNDKREKREYTGKEKRLKFEFQEDKVPFKGSDFEANVKEIMRNRN